MNRSSNDSGAAHVFYRRFVRLLVLLLTVMPLFAQDARQIIEESERRTRSNSEIYEGVLKVLDSGGKVSDKRWRFQRVGSYGNSKAMIRFTAPAEVKGVGLLIVNHPDRASDQWMWTPALDRDRRVAFQDRSTRFFGTDFSFEDLEERDSNQFDFKLMGQENVDGVLCWRIESYPRESKSSQYSHSTVWIHQSNYVPAQLENFVKDRLVRRLIYRRVELVQNIWTALELEMTDLRRNSRTLLTLDHVQYNAPTKSEDFTVQALRREL